MPSYLNVDQLYHTQWMARDGAPTGIISLAQTADGYLWMAAASGLYRFDGVRFEPVSGFGGRQLLSKAIYGLKSSADGGLWIGYALGGASFVKDGRITNYSEPEGLPRSSVSRFLQDATGTMWAGTTRGLFRFADGKWTAAGTDWNAPAGDVVAVVSGSRGMWAAVNDTLLFLPTGAKRFEQSRVRIDANSLIGMVRSPDGVAWLADRASGNVMQLQSLDDGRRLTLNLASRVGEREGVSDILFDRHGHLWLVSPTGASRVRMPDQGSRELRWDDPPSGKPVALTSSVALMSLEDIEGNIWLATTGGLDKLRAPALAKINLPSGSPFPIAPDGAGGVWIGAIQRQLLRFPVGSAAVRNPGPPVHSAWTLFDHFYSDPHGELWIGMPETLWHLSGGRWRSVERPMALRSETSTGNIQTMAMDSTGAIWASVLRAGVYRVAGNTWTLRGGYADLPNEAASVVTADDKGSVWFGYLNSRLARLVNDRVTVFSVSDGLNVGTVRAVATRGDNVWVGGEGGLARFDGRVFHTVTGAGGAAFSTISGIAEMPDGDLWMNTTEGAVHIEAAEIHALSANPAHRVTYRLLDFLDGMPGSPVILRPVPTIAAGGDGKVWFTTINGVVWTDPKLMTRNTVVPSVHVTAVEADGVHHSVSGLGVPLRLPPKTRNIQIEYTAPSLAIPERVRFKYRLEGHEATWQDVGTRREAFYNDLKPGHYRFRVIACNNDNVWNETGASIDLEIPPTFVQTGWFTALWVASALGLLFVGFAMWVRRAKAQVRSRLEERLVERERIARELHDTLLQGVQGLILKLQTVVDNVDMKGEARRTMTDALDRADALLIEGRDRVKDLRAAAVPTGLRQALLEAAEQMSGDHRVGLRVIESGKPREVHPIVREEAVRIAIEAMFNAHRHAEATTIEIELSYERRRLRINVRDDGQGMEESVLRAGREGHFGFMGMHERARRIHGKISIWSRPGAGTEVSLTVPAGMAYVRARWMSRESRVVSIAPPD